MNRASVLLLCAVTVFAQDSKAPAPAKGQEMTMTGCLNKAKDVPQHYSFGHADWSADGQSICRDEGSTRRGHVRCKGGVW
jgi:hypothetical protein